MLIFDFKQTILIIAVIALLACLTGKTSLAADHQSGKGTYIDTHVHLNGRYMQQGTLVKDYDTAVQNLLADMNRYGVAKALIMPPPQIPGQQNAHIPDYQDLLEVVQTYPERLYLVAGGKVLNSLIHQYSASEVTLQIQEEFEEQAEMLIRYGAKGFGETTALHLSFNPRHVFEEVPPDHPLFLLLADIAARHQVPIDLHIEAVPETMDLPAGFSRISPNNPPVLQANIEAFERLLAHNREANIIWQHIGWDNTGYMTIELLQRLVEAHPNLYLSLRIEERLMTMGGAPMPNRLVDNAWQIRQEWLAFISKYPDRFMIGSDEFFGIPGKTHQMPQSFEETWSVLDQLPPDLAKKVGHDNAARIFHLE